MLAAATELLIAGMGFVFVFLTLLVFATGIMSKVINRYFPEPEPVPKTSPAAISPPSAINDKKLTAVISAAVKRYRSRHKQ